MSMESVDCHTASGHNRHAALGSVLRGARWEGWMIGRINVVSLVIGLAVLYAVTAWVFHLSTGVIIVLEVVAFLVFVVSNLVWGRRPKK